LIGKTDCVLDIACGTGYGTFELAGITSGEVFGGDIDADAIASCKEKWQAVNLQYQYMDGTALPFENGKFDVVVSFETIEHTTQYKGMLRELARVLKKSGKLILSTPNINVLSPGGVIKNKFHTQEFTKEELKGLLSEHFTDIQLFGQYYNRYSSITFSFLLEKILLLKGVRKLPYNLRNRFSNYSQAWNYILLKRIFVCKAPLK